MGHIARIESQCSHLETMGSTLEESVKVAILISCFQGNNK